MTFDTITTHLLTEMIPKKMIRKDINSAISSYNLINFKDMMITLIPLLVILAGVGVGLNIAMIQDKNYKSTVDEDDYLSDDDEEEDEGTDSFIKQPDSEEKTIKEIIN